MEIKTKLKRMINAGFWNTTRRAWFLRTFSLLRKKMDLVGDTHGKHGESPSFSSFSAQTDHVSHTFLRFRLKRISVNTNKIIVTTTAINMYLIIST